jgi:hypothetical protein
MHTKFLPTVVVVALSTAFFQPAAAAVIIGQVFPETGEVRLQNRSENEIPFALYTIRSPGGALKSSPADWISITGNYDVNGNGLIDPTNSWHMLPDPPTSNELGEGVFDGPGGFLPPRRAVSLGRIWDINKPFDLTFEVFEPGSVSIGATIVSSIDGDYSGGTPQFPGTVNGFDYTSYWKPTFGSTTDLLADGNLDGVVNAADYVVWRKNLGKSAPQLAAASGSLSPLVEAVPEPTSALLLVVFGTLCRCWRTTGRRFSRR